uniref:hypothetical protein n=1 Tax=Dialister sp. TaxID=1955814 RepID=UPI004024E1DF
RAPAFQAGYEGSIPFTRSRNDPLLGRAFLLSEITGACLSCIQGKGSSRDFPAFPYTRFRNMIR